MKIRILLIALALFALSSSSVYSEEQNRLTVFYAYQHWKLSLPTGTGLGSVTSPDQKTNQGVLGLSATGVLSSRFHVDLNGTLANSTSQLETGNAATDFKQSLSSLNDTRLRVSYAFGDGKGMASIFVNLPTGKKKLDANQYLVTVELADLSRKFMVRRYGQGLDLGAEWYALPRWGNFGLDFGGGYLYHGKYQPLQSDSREYKYGDEIFGKLGFDTYGEPIRASFDVNLRYYSKDKFDNLDAFQAGVTTMINGVIVYSSSFDLSAGGSLMLRGKAKIRATSSQALSDEQFKSGRNELLLYINGGFPVSEKLRALGRLEYQNVSANDFPTGSLEFLPKSHYVGLGGGLGYSLASSLTASSLVTYYAGNIDTIGSLKGLGLTFVLTFLPGQGR
jgi:hypothetical protein